MEWDEYEQNENKKKIKKKCARRGRQKKQLLCMFNHLTKLSYRGV